MSNELNELAKIINRAFGDNTIFTLDGNALDVPRISSGIPTLDVALGGGIPSGAGFIEFFGPEAAGKTYLACLTAAEFQRAGHNVLYIDAENTLRPERLAELGVDLDKVLVSQESGAERVLQMIGEICVLDNAPGLIILDSVAALAPQNEEFDKASVAELARLMAKGSRIINSVNKKTTLLFINQVRETIGPFSSLTTPGGRAIKHAYKIRLEIRAGQRITVALAPKHKRHLGKDPKDVIGFKMQLRVTKNKTAVPFKTTMCDYFVDEGVDIADNWVTIGLANGVIEQTGAWYQFAGEKYQGRTALRTAIADGIIKVDDLIG